MEVISLSTYLPECLDKGPVKVWWAPDGAVDEGREMCFQAEKGMQLL